MEKVKKILIINAYYYPGFRSGGPQQSIMNLVEVFGKQFLFYILTHNHDFGMKEPYKGVKYDSWNDVGDAKVFYYSKNKFSLGFLKQIVNRFEVVYLCEPYQEHSYKVLFLKKLNLVKPRIVLAPMGCFSKGALSLKAGKKNIFWKAFQSLRLYRGIEWSFSSELELKDAEVQLGKRHIEKFYVAADLPRKYIDYHYERYIRVKKAGELRVVFFSRICEMKNLLYAIKIICALKGNVVFDIYGTAEDEDYWYRCKQELAKCPDNIQYCFCGSVESKKVYEVFLKYDVFFLPTKGENFGHVVYEAMVTGCIPVISDRTSWGEIKSRRCGSVLSLEREEDFVKYMQDYVDMDEAKIRDIWENAIEFAKEKYLEGIKNSGYIKIFI